MHYVIGLTGGIACGKSSVSRILKSLGAIIIDADRIGHEVLAPGQRAYQQVVDAFGQEILDLDANIDRKKLGSLVFSCQAKLEMLNSLTHPHIINNIEKQISTNDGIMVLDAALLFETGLDRLCDETWLVTASKEQQIERILSRDGLSRQEAERRIASQNIDFKKEKAGHMIDNSGALSDLSSQVRCLYRRVEEICAKKRREKR